MSRSGVVDWLWCRSREFFSRAGVCGRSWDPHHFPGLAPVPGIPTGLATRGSTGTSTSFGSPPVPGIPTSSRDPHQSRDSHQFPASPPVSRLAEALGPPPVLDLHQFPGSLPALGIRTASQDPHQSRDPHQLSRSKSALGSRTAWGRLEGVQIPKTIAAVGFLCVDMHQAVAGTHHPWGLPRGRRLRGNRNTSKQPSLGRSPEFVRDPLRDSATHGLTELPYGSQQLQPL